MTGFMRIFLLSALTAISALLISCLKSSSGGGDDGNTPYMVLDLHAIASNDSSVTISWTATGDDSNSGAASVYDVRYARTWMNSDVWDSAVKFVGEPQPKVAGQLETLTVRGLQKDTIYYFALNVADEAGNWSGVSNCALGAAFEDVVVTITDPHLESRVRAILGLPTGEIRRSDMLRLNGTLDANGAGVKSLSGIEYATNLMELFMADDSISDLTPITHLTKLVNMQLANNHLTDISPLAGLTEVRALILGINNISDISALATLTKLHLVMLDNNQITDLTPLVNSTGLAATDSIYLGNNPLSQQALNTDIPALEARGVTVFH